MQQHDGGFTTALRPKARVRHSDDEDLAVIDDRTVLQAWLMDSRAAVCVACGHRVRLARPPQDVVAEMIAHRGECRAR